MEDDITPITNKPNMQPVLEKGSVVFFMDSDVSNYTLSDSEIKLLSEILSIPNKTGFETQLVSYIRKYAISKGYKVQSDKMGNLYISKGAINKNEYVPLLNAHTDSVFIEHLDLIGNKQKIEIAINDDIITGYHPITKQQMGIGCDDKNGVFIALMIMERVDKCKAVFTVSEENGMRGATYSIKRKNKSFYSNVGYILALDSPGNRTFTESFFDGLIFNSESEFYRKSEKIIKKHIPEPIFEPHPWTCMVQLRNLLNVQGLNVPASYYSYHTHSEYASIKGIQTAINLCVALIKELGNKKYELKRYRGNNH